MEIDTVITLENNKEYLLLLKSQNKPNYFLAVELNEKQEPTTTYAVFEEDVENGESYMTKINDPLILYELTEDYRNQLDNLIGETEE